MLDVSMDAYLTCIEDDVLNSCYDVLGANMSGRALFVRVSVCDVCQPCDISLVSDSTTIGTHHVEYDQTFVWALNQNVQRNIRVRKERASIGGDLIFTIYGINL